MVLTLFGKVTFITEELLNKNIPDTAVTPDLRQHRIIQVCGLRSKIFRQVVQINQGKADALPRFFGQADGIIFKQAVRLELCGVALNSTSDRE